MQISRIIRFFHRKTKIWRLLRISGITLGILLLFIHDLGSGTDQAYFSERSEMYFNKYQNRFDNLIVDYDQYIQEAVDKQLTPGAAVAIVYHGSVLLMKGYGERKNGTGEPVNENTLFRLGSVSKGFASVLAGLMVDEGYLDWDDAVSGYLDDFDMKDTTFADSLTIMHILSQTSGFPVHAYTDRLDAGVPYDQIKDLLAELPFAYKPGVVYTYQNAVYSLIGDVLQKVSGKSYGSLLSEKIFIPLNMSHASSDFLTMSSDTNAASPHLRTKYGWTAKALNDRYYSVAPASGINASVSDMAKWLLALTGNSPEVIPEATVKDVTTSRVYTPLLWTYRGTWRKLQRTSYGMGWRIFRFRDHDIAYHGGYVEGYKTEIAFDPKEDLGIVVLLNSNTTFASSSIPYFFELFMDQGSNNTGLAMKSMVAAGSEEREP